MGMISMKDILKKIPLKKTLLIVISIIFVIFLGAAAYTYSLLSNIKQTNISIPQATVPPAAESTSPSSISITPPSAITPAAQKPRDVINIALFGLDNRGNERGRSDTIMIASIDNDYKKIKLTSLMRDMYVDIPGRGGDRINHAYAYGGPALAVSTINHNFDMDIEYYATVDFKGLEKLIDNLGGVDIDVKQGEIKYLNFYINELNNTDKDTQEPFISSPGMQHLNGRQAVGYMRIRYYGNADFERTERQRVVLAQLLNNVRDIGILKLPGIIGTLLPYIETNMPKVEILSLGASALSCSTIEQYRLPEDGTFKYQTIREMSVLVPDMAINNQRLHDFIYNIEEIESTATP